MTTPLLSVADLTAGYGPIAAVRGVSLEVHAGEVVALLGANGAGKTTTIRAITGMLRPWSGVVRLDGEVISGRSSDEVAGRGVATVPEGRQVFADLTVDENLRIGAYRRGDRQAVQRTRQEVLETFPPLQQRLRQRAGTLSGGEQQMLAVARALMLDPRLLLLDEPSMGLAPKIVEHLYEILARIVGTGVTALLVEQNARMALSVCTRGYVMVNGTIVHEGSAADLRASAAVADAYLGGGRRTPAAPSGAAGA